MTRRQRRAFYRILGAALLLAAAVVLTHTLLAKAALGWQLMVFLPAYLLVGLDVLRKAGRNLVHGQVFDENFLMALATLGALGMGFLPAAEPEFAEAVFVMIFYQTGELFQSVAVGKSRRSIAALMSIRPDTARVVRNGAELEVAPDAVAVGEVIAVRAGERIPLDGIVLEGESEINTLALTGEAAPRFASVGDTVISGCTNISGMIRVRVTRAYAQSTVARILQLVEESAARKSRSERFITRFARFYTPSVVIAAVMLAFLPPLLAGDFAGHFARWLARALSFLVISCPCALVISVPLAFFGGIGGASRMGVLIKGSNYLEALARTEIAVFDKTGTLTKGSFTVTEIVSRGISHEALLLLAAAVEAQSNHPVAKAVVRAAGEADLPQVTQVSEIAGKGVQAVLDGAAVAVGNAALMRAVDVEPPAVSSVGSVVFVARDGAYLGHIVISDAVKLGAAAAIAALRQCGVRRTVMLTGDRRAAAAETAAALGISEWRAELLPADKVVEVETLLATPRKGTLAFVGDGINDAPVLTRADVGIAMGALGADAAIEAADVVLMDDDPRKLATAVRHARRTLGIVRQNIVLALGVKGAILACSALGLLGAWQMPLAIFADVGVAVLAILNSMRALRVQAKKPLG
ncbi:MAG: cadmium-translocating P-type ATPase [Clostridia bacterium]|nr:cadmium-translocating P-type ATPase [Clostridia bacterium]